MSENASRSVAVVGVGAVLPDAPNAPAFWANLKAGRYSISETPPGRWDPALYYDADPHAPDKTYSKIGGWVREYEWSPLEWGLPVPPRVSDAMDRGQKWSVGACREALLDYGYPDRPLDAERTAVVLGNAMAGDQHYLTALPIYLPEYVEELDHLPTFAALPSSDRTAVVEELREAIHRRLPGVSEDSMPGELGNIIAGRVANLLNLRGPNYIVDAACASALAAIDAAVEGLERHAYDAVLTGGVDANMSASSFVKFCKIGALSATGTRPYYDGADGFVMGEGAAVFLLKRLADAERDGDHIYGVLRGVAGASDGKGKGITAPNPVGQRLAIARAWNDAARIPDEATYVEGHGTSTKVGDVVEVDSLSAVFAGFGLRPGTVPLGSVKSNVGHLKSAAGAAGLLKALYALDEKVLPPSLGGTVPNPNIDFSSSPFYINDELREWKTEPGHVRSVGVSAFGFGGTNFHAVVEEYVPGRIQPPAASTTISLSTPRSTPAQEAKAPPRGALVIGGATDADVLARAREIHAEALAGRTPSRSAPADADLRAAVRLAIDFGDAAELAAKADRAITALEGDQPAMWRALRNQGVFLGRGAPAPVAFLYTGQGSQYVNMLATLRHDEPIVAETFAEADEVMTPLLGRPLSEYLFVDSTDAAALAAADEWLRQTEITQPAILAVDTAITRLLSSYGVEPDMVMGHSLGEYGALVASGALSFADALEAVSARGREMTNVAIGDCGRMAAVFAPLEEIERTLAEVDGYVVIANINSRTQAVVGGATAAVEAAVARLSADGHQAILLPVSHAFHTEIVAAAAAPLKAVLRRLHLESPAIPLVANVDGDFYPMGPNVVDRMIDLLGRQIASPVQFVKGLGTLYDAGCRVFVEVGPKRALHGFVEEVLGGDPEVVSIFSNHPKQGDIMSFNQALCGLYAAGRGAGAREARSATPPPLPTAGSPIPANATPSTPTLAAPAPSLAGTDTYLALGKLFADVLAQGNQLVGQQPSAPPAMPVVVTGAGLGLPGGERVFGDDKVPAILAGEQLIDTIPVKQREKIVDKHITRLVKTEGGGGRFEPIQSEADVIKLAGRSGILDLVEDFGFPAERAEALDVTSMLAIGAGIDALRDAGIPLVMHYKTATTGRMLPERWMLPEAYRDTTGVIFASAFPGCDSLVGELDRYHGDQTVRRRLEDLRGLRARLPELGGGVLLAEELDHRIHALATELEDHPYEFDRKFLFHALSMGHSQLAEYIGARGPNTQVNSACASTTQAVALAEDWIRAGRCERVVIVSGDDVTTDRLLEWVGAGFLASGAAATDDVVADAAVPFDLRRHGMILGMGAAAIVVEAAQSAGRRGIQPIAEVLGTATANSAFHGSRLDQAHISQVMEDLVATAERRWGIDRHEIAPSTVFISHETYTPARGGSAQAEIASLRRVFGPSAGQVVISNTKGFTGHAMGVGIEDVVAIKAIETGIVPPVPNYKVPDPELGELNLSHGGTYPIRYALRLGAGFGSQVSMTLYRLVPSPTGRHPEPDELGFEYRIVDPEAWQSWLVASCGLPSAVTEITKRTLRIRDDGPPAPGVPAVPTSETAGLLAPTRAVEVPAVPAPAPTAGDVTAQSAPVTAESGGDGVEQKVLEIVAAQTGYPSDLLDLDLDLEADLGIDTVKQAETFAAIRAAYDIERDDRLALRDYPTLRHVIAFVYERAPALTARTAGDVAGAPTAGTAIVAPTAGLVEGDDAEAAAIPRRVPTAVLRPALELCRPTGLTLGEGSRVVVMLDDGDPGQALTRLLEERGVTVFAVDGAPSAEELTSRLDAFTAAGPVDGVYWLPALDVEPPVSALDLAGWRELLRRRVKLLYTTMHHLGEAVGGSGTFLVSATRLGGRHGYDVDGAEAPMGGAVTGFTKAFRREHPDALVKAVDVAMDATPEAVADLLIEETLRDPGVIEVGHSAGQRWTVALQEVALGTAPAGIELGPDTVFAITGAAGSIVTAITADLARASRGTFHLLDLVAHPDPADPDIGAFATDKEGLKRTIFERLQAAGQRVTPVLVDRELARIERSHAALGALRAVEAAGATVQYHSVDLRDGDAVEAVIERIFEASGRIDVLVHAAGLEVSHRLADKTAEEYDLVFDVKADGWFNLLHGLGDGPLGAAVVFSSVAGRFGNAGQTDYSAANDLLCKEISSLGRARPGTLGIAIDWTAWGDIGMATRGSIPTVMKAAGIDMLPARAGIPIVRRELMLRETGGEVVIGQRLGVLADELAPDGGLDLSPGGPVARLVGDGSALFSEVVGWPVGVGLTVAATLDPADQPFLHDHQIDGTPVLPGVMGVEAFAEAALLLHPERFVAAVEGVEFLAPFKFYRNEPRLLTVTCQVMANGDDLLARCALLGTRHLAGQLEPEVKLHYTGTVRLSSSPPELAPVAPPSAGEPVVTADEIYRIYFHGPAYQVLEQAWASDGGMAGRFARGLPPAFHPEDRSLATAPRLLELAFQTAGMWEIGTTGTLNLPAGIGRVIFAAVAETADPITALVRPSDGDTAATVVDGEGRVLVELSGYGTVPLPVAIDDELVAPIRRACDPTG